MRIALWLFLVALFAPMTTAQADKIDEDTDTDTDPDPDPGPVMETPPPSATQSVSTSFSPSPPPSPSKTPVIERVVDSLDDWEKVSITGTWNVGSHPAAFNKFYLYGFFGTARSVAFELGHIQGRYEVFVWYNSLDGYAESVPVWIATGGFQIQVTVNMARRGGTWTSIGLHNFVDDGVASAVIIDVQGTIGTVVADAVRIFYSPPSPTPTPSTSSSISQSNSFTISPSVSNSIYSPSVSPTVTNSPISPSPTISTTPSQTMAQREYIVDSTDDPTLITFFGTWTSRENERAYGGAEHVAGEDAASFGFVVVLPESEFHMYLYYAADVSYSNEVVVRVIFPGSTPRFFTLDMTSPSGGFDEGETEGWAYLGDFDMTSTAIAARVDVFANDNGIVVADAVRAIRIGPTPPPSSTPASSPSLSPTPSYTYSTTSSITITPSITSTISPTISFSSSLSMSPSVSPTIPSTTPSPSPSQTVPPAEVIVDAHRDSALVELIGQWDSLQSSAAFGGDYYLARPDSTPTILTYMIDLPAGEYHAEIWYLAGSSRDTSVPIKFTERSGRTHELFANMQGGGSAWTEIGIITLRQSGIVRVSVNASMAMGVVVADAIRLRATQPSSSPLPSPSRDIPASPTPSLTQQPVDLVEVELAIADVAGTLQTVTEEVAPAFIQSVLAFDSVLLEEVDLTPIALRLDESVWLYTFILRLPHNGSRSFTSIAGVLTSTQFLTVLNQNLQTLEAVRVTVKGFDNREPAGGGSGNNSTGLYIGVSLSAAVAIVLLVTFACHKQKQPRARLNVLNTPTDARQNVHSQSSVPTHPPNHQSAHQIVGPPGRIVLEPNLLPTVVPLASTSTHAQTSQIVVTSKTDVDSSPDSARSQASVFEKIVTRTNTSSFRNNPHPNQPATSQYAEVVGTPVHQGEGASIVPNGDGTHKDATHKDAIMKASESDSVDSTKPTDLKSPVPDCMESGYGDSKLTPENMERLDPTAKNTQEVTSNPEERFVAAGSDGNKAERGTTTPPPGRIVLEPVDTGSSNLDEEETCDRQSEAKNQPQFPPGRIRREGSNTAVPIQTPSSVSRVSPAVSIPADSVPSVKPGVVVKHSLIPRAPESRVVVHKSSPPN